MFRDVDVVLRNKYRKKIPLKFLKTGFKSVRNTTISYFTSFEVNTLKKDEVVTNSLVGYME